jgi:hypothetical protein
MANYNTEYYSYTLKRHWLVECSGLPSTAPPVIAHTSSSAPHRHHPTTSISALSYNIPSFPTTTQMSQPPTLSSCWARLMMFVHGGTDGAGRSSHFPAHVLNAEISLPGVSSPSPVTWQVICWVIFPLAINSMAQPSGKILSIPSRYRIYLSSSPILCVADAVSAIFGLTFSMLILRVNPIKASKLVMKRRIEGIISVEKVEYRPAKFQSRTWARTLFFVLGALPAAIKLCSFTGLPWTKTWGIMFLSSFIVIEFITLLSRFGGTEHNNSTPEILGHSELEWQEPHLDFLRRKAEVIIHVFVLYEAILFLALPAHLGLIMWALEKLWSAGVNQVNIPGYIYEPFLTFQSCYYIILVAFFTVWAVLKCMGRIPKGHVLSRILKYYYWFGMVMAAVYMPIWKKSGQQNWLFTGIIVLEYIFAVLILMHWISLWVCKRWPVVGRMLLIAREPQLASEKVKGDGEEEAEDEKDRGPIDPEAWLCFSFFFTSLVAFSMWYGFMYNEIGTVNPPWTNVF